MNSYEKNKVKNVLPGVISFVLPAVMATLIFFSEGIYIGGPKTLFTYDLRAEFIAYYGYLNHGGPGYDNLLHSMTGGLGGAFLGTLLVYVSPFDLIYSFVPLRFLPDAVYLMTLLKIGLCGLFCNLYISKNGKFSLSAPWSIALSCGYALMSYNLMYFVAPMWYDAVMLLPLLALCLERIISGKKSALFVILMALCIISNYYTAYMNAIALVLYFLFRIIEEGISGKVFFKRLCSFAIHGVLSACVSLFVIVPTVLDLSRGKALEENLSETESFIKNSFFDVIKSFFPQQYAGYEYNASPNIYCGSVVAVLVLFWLIYGKKNIRGRIASLGVVAVFFASFILGPLDRVWHGFRDPICLSVRYAYTFSFFMICFAGRGLSVFKELKITTSKLVTGLCMWGVILYSMAELYVNGAFLVANIEEDCYFSTYEEYGLYVDTFDRLLSNIDVNDPGAYGRTASSLKYSGYDGALFGFDGIDKFCSSYNYYVSDMFRKLGTTSLFQTLESRGVTYPVKDLLGVRYEITYDPNVPAGYELIDTYGYYSIYRNDNALPLAFEIADNAQGEKEAFTEDVFENINLLLSDIFGYDNTYDNKVFKSTDYVLTDQRTEETDSGTAYIADVSVTPDFDGRYYWYWKSKYSEDKGMHYLVHIEDVGILPAGYNCTLNLQNEKSEFEEIYVDYLDENRLDQVIDDVNGFYVNEINDSGITLKGFLDNDSSVLITLPYEDGYKITVDGVKTEYDYYRDVFLKLDLPAGEHVIEIKYMTPGLVPGIVMSCICIVFTVGFFRKKPNEVRV